MGGDESLSPTVKDEKQPDDLEIRPTPDVGPDKVDSPTTEAVNSSRREPTKLSEPPPPSAEADPSSTELADTKEEDAREEKPEPRQQMKNDQTDFKLTTHNLQSLKNSLGKKTSEDGSGRRDSEPQRADGATRSHHQSSVNGLARGGEVNGQKSLNHSLGKKTSEDVISKCDSKLQQADGVARSDDRSSANVLAQGDEDQKSLINSSVRMKGDGVDVVVKSEDSNRVNGISKSDQHQRLIQSDPSSSSSQHSSSSSSSNKVHSTDPMTPKKEHPHLSGGNNPPPSSPVQKQQSTSSASSSGKERHHHGLNSTPSKDRRHHKTSSSSKGRSSIGVQCRRDKNLDKYVGFPPQGSTSMKFSGYSMGNPCPSLAQLGCNRSLSGGRGKYKFAHLMRVETYPNGGGKVLHMWQDEIDALARQISDEKARNVALERIAEEFLQVTIIWP